MVHDDADDDDDDREASAVGHVGTSTADWDRVDACQPAHVDDAVNCDPVTDTGMERLLSEITACISSDIHDFDLPAVFAPASPDTDCEGPEKKVAKLFDRSSLYLSLFLVLLLLN